MRARVLAVVAALAVFASACGAVPAQAAAVVGDARVSMEQFSQLVAARVQGLGLEGRDLQLAREGRELGLLDPARVREGVSQALSDGELSQQDLPSLPQPVADDLFAAAREALGDDYAPALEELGVDEDTWRDVHARAAQRLVAGIIYFGQQQPPTIPLAHDDYVRQVQAATLSELVSAELTRQQFSALGLELDPGEVSSREEQIRSSFDSSEAFQAALEQPGRTYPTEEDFQELIVRTQVRQEVLQQQDNAEEAARVRDEIDVQVASRFGTWDPQQGRVVASEV